MDPNLNKLLQSVSDILFPDELGKARVQIDSAGVDGDTPLHVLIWRNDTSGALLVIENGAPVNAIGDMGETPLHIAMRMNNKALVHALIEAGARTDIVSEFGQTPSEVPAKEIRGGETT